MAVVGDRTVISLDRQVRLAAGALVLSGIASPDTRKVLESGENPLLASATPDDLARAKAAGVSTDDPSATMTADDNSQMQDLRNMTPQQRAGTPNSSVSLRIRSRKCATPTPG